MQKRFAKQKFVESSGVELHPSVDIEHRDDSILGEIPPCAGANSGPEKEPHQ